MFFYYDRVKAYISNGWDKNIIDPDPQKKYTLRKGLLLQPNLSLCEARTDHDINEWDADGWPKGPYTQQVEGVLPCILTDDIVTAHLKSSGKQLQPRKWKVNDSTNIDYSTLQRGHQFFMESYIPGRYVRFCCKANQIWIKARCYRSQRKSDPMHYVNVSLSCDSPHYVTHAYCSCIAGKSGICSHVVGLLKQLIHYVMMKVKVVPADLTCTQMQQTWHKPRPTQIEAEPVMNVCFRKASQMQNHPKRDPVVCTLYEARAQGMQAYSIKQQEDLKAGLLKSQSQCAFAQILNVTSEEHVSTHFGEVPKGSVLSYQLSDYEKVAVLKPQPSVHHNLPELPLSAVSGSPTVPSDIGSDQQSCLEKLMVTLEEAHMLEQSTRQQSASAKWQASRLGRVTASRFGDILLRQSSPSTSFVKSFLERKEYSTLPVQLKHGHECEIKARNAYVHKTGLTVRACGLVVNPTFPWLGASPDGLVHDPLEASVGLLEIKCPYTYRLCTVQEATSDSKFFANMGDDGTVALKRTDKYFYQVQGQMALSGILWCDFVIFTFKNHTIERIRFDSLFWESMQSRLTNFFFQHVLPASTEIVHEE